MSLAFYHHWLCESHFCTTNGSKWRLLQLPQGCQQRLTTIGCANLTSVQPMVVSCAWLSYRTVVNRVLLPLVVRISFLYNQSWKMALGSRFCTLTLLSDHLAPIDRTKALGAVPNPVEGTQR